MKEFGGLSRFQIDDEVKRIMSEKTGTEQQDKSFDRLLLNSWYQKQRETKLKGN